MVECVRIAVPVHVAGALRDLVRDLAVGTLVLREESQCAVAHELHLTDAGHGERVDRRIATEEPAEAGAIAGTAAQAVPGHQSATEVGIADHRFIEIDLCVLHGAVKQRVRRAHGQHRRAQRVRVFHPTFPLALGGARREQRTVHRQRRVARHLSAGQHDRDVGDVCIDVPAGRFAETGCGVAFDTTTDAENELRWCSGQHVRRHVRRFSDRR